MAGLPGRIIWQNGRTRPEFRPRGCRMDWNLTDLTKLVGLSAAAFAVLRVAVGRPLVAKVINPHRMIWLFAALGFLSGAAGLLRWEAKSADPAAWMAPLRTLVSEEKATAQVMVAAFALFNGLVILGLLGYCLARLPRDPGTFTRPKDRAKVVRYYTVLNGGLDFAALVRLPKADGAVAAVLATGVNRKELDARLFELIPSRTAEQQIQWWTDLAVEVHREMDRLNKVFGAGGQGINRRVLFDVQFGGYLFQYLRPPEIGDDFLFLFGATLTQAEVRTRRFEEHFELLVQALRNIKAEAEKM
jgi:hypothetical protein